MSREPEKIYYNPPQIKMLMVDAKEMYGVMGRALGKSEGIIAPRSERNVHSMPRSMGGFLASTYAQLLQRTLPPVIRGWERLGYKKDRDFFIGKRPPKKWNWPEPYFAPISYDYFIPWYNGSGISLISQDRPGSSNGLSLDWFAGDESKYLKKEKIDNETMPANRGNIAHFGHRPEHHSVLFLTDMPTNRTGKWILDKEKEMDPKLIDLIMYLQLEINRLIPLNTSYSRDKIKRYQGELDLLRRNAVYYLEASSLENIQALGADYFKQMKRTLPDIEFRTSILNERMISVENGFYALFDDDLHCYDSYDYSYIDSLGNDLTKLATIDSRQDGDVVKDAPLNIALDYGASINNLVVGQEVGNEFRNLNHLFVKHPDRLEDLMVKFCEYYMHHKDKTVYYWYDHTAVGTNAISTASYADEVHRILTKYGWNVIHKYIGQAPSHASKYLLFQLAFTEDKRIVRIRYNRQNCKYLILSMQNAPVKEGRNGFEKDKSSERNHNTPQEEATHASDAGDTLYYGMYALNLKELPEFIANVIS